MGSTTFDQSNTFARTTFRPMIQTRADLED